MPALPGVWKKTFDSSATAKLGVLRLIVLTGELVKLAPKFKKRQLKAN